MSFTVPPPPPSSYHTALQSHKQSKNVICPFKDPEDSNISEHTFYSGFLEQGKTHKLLLQGACPRRRMPAHAEGHSIPS